MLKRRGFVSCAVCAAIGLVATAEKGQAQGMPGLKRTVIQKTEFPGDKYVCILMSVEIDANTSIPRHTHPGVESSIVEAGGGTLSQKGQADRVVKAGEGFQIPPETPHALRNGPETTRLAITYIVEKDKPLVTLAPE
jgi:quercetin dioxygenase-like cupin family protein